MVALHKSLLDWRHPLHCLQLAFFCLVLQASELHFVQTVQEQWQLEESQKCLTELCCYTLAESRDEAQEGVPALQEKGRVEDQDHPRLRRVPSVLPQAAMLWRGQCYIEERRHLAK